MSWNLGDIFDAVAAAVPSDRPAIIQGERVTSWGELDARSNRVARAFLDLGLQAGDRVAIISRNHPAYIEGFVACLKARLAPVNINYRYKHEEIAYVFKDADVRAVLFQQEFADVVEELRAAMPHIQAWIRVDGPESATAATRDFEALASTGDSSPLGIERSPDDPLLLYTGGTTGMPKGVIWPASKYRACQMESPLVVNRPKDLAEHVELVRNNPNYGRVIPACPLMHGAGLSSSLAELLVGGTAIILSSRQFDADELWREAARNRATRILIVGDVFARPMLQALETAKEAYDLSALKVISSAGLMWSREVKRGLLSHLSWISLADILGASEAAGLGFSITTKDKEVPTGRFIPGPKTVILDESGKPIPNGAPGQGLIARAEPLPQGYLGDPKKTAEVFREIDGERYSIPGDMAERFEDGTMMLIGRGSLVVNTGGEKVFVEEVEEVLRQEPDVEDALVVGVPDAKWGSAVAALVKLAGANKLDEDDLRQRMGVVLASYKIPKHIFVVDVLPRADSGKAEYRKAKEMVADRMAQLQVH